MPSWAVGIEMAWRNRNLGGSSPCSRSSPCSTSWVLNSNICNDSLTVRKLRNWRVSEMSPKHLNCISCNPMQPKVHETSSQISAWSQMKPWLFKMSEGFNIAFQWVRHFTVSPAGFCSGEQSLLSITLMHGFSCSYCSHPVWRSLCLISESSILWGFFSVLARINWNWSAIAFIPQLHLKGQIILHLFKP